MSKAEIVVAIIVAAFGSTGFWTFIMRYMDSKSATREMLLGLGRKILKEECSEYLARGWISIEELADLEKYLYTPYRKLGGNGTGEILFNKVNCLPNSDSKEVEMND